MGVISELKRRNVLRMAALYVVAAWLVMQVAEVLIGLGVLPESIGLWVTIVLAIGFPIALVVSWFYELTPEGLALDTDGSASESVTTFGGRRVDFVIIAILSAAVLLLAGPATGGQGSPRAPVATSVKGIGPSGVLAAVTVKV